MSEETIEEKKVIKKKPTDIELQEVPTQTALMVKLPNGETVSQIEYLVWLGNEILAIKRAVA